MSDKRFASFAVFEGHDVYVELGVRGTWRGWQEPKSRRCLRGIFLPHEYSCDSDDEYNALRGIFR